jgi:Na+/H+ antiporter NhaD/arsenite permease-like protein
VLAALAVFVVCYSAIAAGRVPGLSLDRPTAALAGAVLMVAAGVISPRDAAQAVNGDTIGLLLGMMILSELLGQAGFFRWAGWRVVAAARTPRALLWGLTFAAGGLAALLVNDTVCVMMTPLVLALVDEAELPPLPYLLAVAFGANAGSAATLVGNPQNVIVGALSGISFARFTLALALPALVALGVAALLLQLLFRRELPHRHLAPAHAVPPTLDGPLLRRALLGLSLAVLGFLAGLPLAWTALAAATLALALAPRSPRAVLARLDWPLLVFFAGLFVVVAGVGRSGLAEWIYDRAVAPALGVGTSHQAVVFSGFATLASQLVSNVPFVLLAGSWIPNTADPDLMWLATALSSTLAGNLTIVGSVANIIVLELAGERGRIGFWRFLAYGLPVTALTLAAALAVLLGERSLGFLAGSP